MHVYRHMYVRRKNEIGTSRLVKRCAKSRATKSAWLLHLRSLRVYSATRERKGANVVYDDELMQQFELCAIL